ncbi:SUMO-activating enzyme subunit 1-like [Convolutriloba macropyga]|uniref:SUMO-activating enzyme subunit 1-like n=1 Tax=Convolutriloba macropyga TaxID=536237 RepID=UPI003F51B1D5
MTELTEAEAAVYDRQLRVWGVETQKRLNNSRVLVAGMCGLSAETCKNIILAGVGSLTLMDSTPSTARKPGNFLVPADCDPASSVAEVSAATLRDMNPLVAVKVAEGMPEDVQSSDGLAGYDVVVLLDAPLRVQIAWDEWTTERGAAFFTGSVCGPFAHFFTNLHSHTFTAAGNSGDGPVEKRAMQFCSLTKALGADWGCTRRRCHKMYYQLAAASSFEMENARAPKPSDHERLCDIATAMAEKGNKTLQSTATAEGLRDYLAAGAFPQAAPVSAVAGGVLAQEVLKGVSQKGEPVGNFFFFSLSDCAGTSEKVGC